VAAGQESGATPRHWGVTAHAVTPAKCRFVLVVTFFGRK
jgi:hypothetical protein